MDASIRGTVAVARGLPGAGVVLAVLLAGDAAFVLCDVLHREGALADERFSLARERGWAELFQYAKLALTVPMLAWWAAAARSWGILFWAAAFAFLLVDDAFTVHERMGGVVADVLHLPAIGSVRPSQLGEALFSTLAGGTALVGVAAMLSGASGATRQLTLVLCAGFVLLAIFAVGVDLLHSAMLTHPLEPVLAVVEDGGELAITSTLVWMVWMRAAGSRAG